MKLAAAVILVLFGFTILVNMNEARDRANDTECTGSQNTYCLLLGFDAKDVNVRDSLTSDNLNAIALTQCERVTAVGRDQTLSEQIARYPESDQRQMTDVLDVMIEVYCPDYDE